MGKALPDISLFAAGQTLSKTALAPLLNDYEILNELPRGGQAVVYRAIHKATKMEVALKVLRPELQNSEKALRHFEREVELAASLKHPHIVTLHDSGILRRQYYFSMEYIPGRSLDDYVCEQDLSIKEIVRVFVKIGAAMTHAHQRGVIHRDLKPTNILVDKQGQPKVVDFGLAKADGLPDGETDRGATLTLVGEIKGTLSYMSPEQAAGQSERVDVRSDVYSLGVILYRLLCGCFPYTVDASPLQVLQTIQRAEPIRPRQACKDLDADIEAIVMKCLSRDPGDRYQSASELTEDLRRWLDRRPVLARSLSSWYLLQKIISRHRYTATVAGLLLLIVLSFGVISIHLYHGTLRSRAESQAHASRLEEESNFFGKQGIDWLFVNFLELYQKDAQRARRRRFSFEQGSKEGKAIDFLYDPDGMNDGGAAFLSRFPPDQIWFAQYCLGERFRAVGKLSQAKQAYQEGVIRLPQPVGAMDIGKTNHLKARLFELQNLDGPAKPEWPGEPRGQDSPQKKP